MGQLDQWKGNDSDVNGLIGSSLKIRFGRSKCLDWNVWRSSITEMIDFLSKFMISMLKTGLIKCKFEFVCP